MLNKSLVCKQISILYYRFENIFGTILKSLAVKSTHHYEELLTESAFTKGFNLSGLKILFIFKGKQGIS